MGIINRPGNNTATTDAVIKGSCPISIGITAKDENTSAGTSTSILMRLIGLKSGFNQRPIKIQQGLLQKQGKVFQQLEQT
ncbi:hypothetical protein [Psychromonas sp. KJ10-2]|uniref:hypothetical protein n=1 Tax=Psychromonas sp. KJ10-2 TaxID=3391822 RepID=UPI0039B40CF9